MVIYLVNWAAVGLSELSHAIRRVADAVVAHAGGADAQSRRINDSYAAFRSSVQGSGAGAPVA